MKTVLVSVRKFVALATYRERRVEEESEECVGFSQTWTNEFCN